jgi:hypothetical protein
MTSVVGRVLRITALGACVSAAAASVEGQALPPTPISKEVRLDAVMARSAGAQVGAMVHIPAGLYMRVGLGASSGVQWRSGVAHSATRVDLLIRALFDPLRETRFGPSIGGGVSVTNGPDGRWRPYLGLAIDIEGRRRGAYVPAVQLGIGGGVRLGIAIRSAHIRWR